MKILYFTKPKPLTIKCLQYLIGQGAVLKDGGGVVLPQREADIANEFNHICKENSLDVYFDEDIYCYIEKFRGKLDLVVSNTYPHRIGSMILKEASFGGINFHAAPLPEYKGVFGYNFAFLNEETQFGVSCHYLTRDFDEGDLIEVDRFPFDFENRTLKELIVESEIHLLHLFQKVMNRFLNGERIAAVPQSAGTYYSRKDFDNAKHINLSAAEKEMVKTIRAFWYPPYEGAYIKICGEKYYLMSEKDWKEVYKNHDR